MEILAAIILVVAIILDTEDMVSFYHKLDLGTDSSATLVGNDHKLRARSSWGRLGPGQDISKSRIWKELKIRPSGIYLQKSLVDEITRYYAYRQLEYYPLVVAIGVSVDDVLEAANSSERLIYTIALLASILVALSAVILIYQIKNSNDLKAANVKAEQEILFRQHVEEKLRDREKELIRSNEELSQFAYIASHDLQEPLRKVQFLGDILATDYKSALDETALEYLNLMCDAANRMRNLINDLLSFSKIRVDFNAFRLISLNQILDNVLLDLELTLNETKATINCPPLPDIEADGAQIHRVFQNIISNALKYRKPDQPPVLDISFRLISGN